MHGRPVFSSDGDGSPMTVVAARPRPARARQGTTAPAFRLPGWVWGAAFAAVVVLAVAIRVRLLVQSGGLDGSDGYDDGVYYAAADALLHGRLPYRDFLLLQPPGTILALTPFAWLGSLTRDPYGVVAARLLFIGVGGLNAALAMRIARRYGLVAAAIAGVGYAVFFPAAYTERSTLLEPLGTCGLLLAVLLAERAARAPRFGMLLAGAAAGVAMGMRIWYVVPVALIAAVHWRSAVRFALGAAIASAAICLPFLVASPAAMVREVVLDQLGRPRMTTPSLFKRVATVLGATDLHLPQPWSALLSVNKVGLVLLVGLVACCAVAFTVRGARLYPLTAIAAVVVLLASPSFFLHYAALAAPWVVLTVAVGVARMLAHLRSVPLRGLLTALLLVLVAAQNLRAVEIARSSSPIPVSTLRPAALQVHGCVLADDPQILAALDVLSRDLQRGCRLWPDVTGATYDRDSMKVAGVLLPRLRNEAWQEDVTRYLLSGDAVVVHRAATQLDPDSSRLIRSGRVLAHTGNWTLHAVSR
jgi:alpha-1,2-mannosyltransferase